VFWTFFPFIPFYYTVIALEPHVQGDHVGLSNAA
jgi:hypothetical protein